MELDRVFHRVYEEMDTLFAIPLILVGLAVVVIFGNFLLTGEFVEKGIDFSSGTEITYNIRGDFSTTEIEGAFVDAGYDNPSVLRQENEGRSGAIVTLPGINSTEADALDENTARQILEDAGINAEVGGLRTVSAAVSAEFFKQSLMAFVMAFTIMSTVIFVAFRDVTPSMAVVFAATGDILIALAGMIVMGIPLTLGSMAALLMLIGYSVDTDIVLSTRTLKRDRGSLQSRIWSSTKTGVTMSSGGLAGFVLLYLVSLAIVGPSELSNIAGVMVIGLAADIPLTWLGNAYILRKYIESDGNIDLSMEKVKPWS